MDSAYQHAQAMAQSPFFYYNPDPKSETRQHGHFTPHPHVQSQPFLQHVPPVPSTPIYSRPTSSCSQPPVPVQIFNATMQLANAPVASPRPLPQKPTILVQEHSGGVPYSLEATDADMYFYPSTPPLSTSGSTVNSPSSYDMLQTPLDEIPFCGAEYFNCIKDGRQAEVQSENLAALNWMNRGSPPFTPGKLRALPAKCGTKVVVPVVPVVLWCTLLRYRGVPV
jgi:hypothetical protein